MIPAPLQLHRSYLWARRRIRKFVMRHPRIDLAVGKRLVLMDVWLRRHGLVIALDPSAQEIEFSGLRFGFDPHNRDFAATVLSTGSYEPETLEAILGQLRPGGVFVDLGANIGF